MLGSTSDYGTMSNQIEGLDEDRLEDMIPGLNLGAESQTIFNDISIEERRERIQSILSEIMSVPRLSEATLTHRSTRRDEKNPKSHRGSAMSSIRNGKVSVLRSISTPKLDFIPEKKPEKKKLLKPRLVPKFTAGGGGASGASKKASNLGNDTQNELRFNPPTFGDETTVSNSRASFNDSRTSETSPEQGERPTNFVLENIRSSSAATHKPAGREEPELPPIKHKSGIVPKYLKARQRQWRDEAQAVIDNTPDVDCPPGHIKLGRTKIFLSVCLFVPILTNSAKILSRKNLENVLSSVLKFLVQWI